MSVHSRLKTNTTQFITLLFKTLSFLVTSDLNHILAAAHRKSKMQRCREKVNDMQEPYGAMIERGKILSITSEGARVQSLSREGVQTPPLPFLSGCSANVGEQVYFFMFDDGRGMVMSKIP